MSTHFVKSFAQMFALLSTKPFFCWKQCGAEKRTARVRQPHFAFYFFILWQVVAAWEAHGNNRRIAALDGEGVVPDRMAAGLVGEMTGEPVPIQPQGESSRHVPIH